METLDRTSLTISDQEFENNVEAAVSAIAEGHSSPKRFPSSVASQDTNGTKTLHAAARKFAGATNASPRMSQVNLLQSIDAGRVSGSQPSNSRKGSLAVEANSESNRPGEEDRAAVASILRSIQRPLSSIGRIFSEDGNQEQRVSEGRRNSFLGSLTPSISDNRKPSRSPSRVNRNSDLDHSKGNAIPGNAARDFELNPEDAAARHASAELAEAQRVQRAEQRIVVE